MTSFQLKLTDQNSVTFSDDSVSTKDIKHTEMKYRLLKLVDKIFNKTITKDEVEFFQKNSKEFNKDPFYVPKSRDQLMLLIEYCIDYFGVTCNLNWIDVSSFKSLSSVFYNCRFTGDISKWDVSLCENMENMFNHSAFNSDISNWNVSRVKSMKYMFDESVFNHDISKWDVSNVTDMNHMFCKSSFSYSLALWDVSNVKDMSSMFRDAKEFNGHIGNWDVRNVKDMSYMFEGTTFDSDISKWDVSHVENMRAMFAYSKFNHDISKWDVSNVNDMKEMFYNSEFSKNISDWKISFGTDITEMFSWCQIPAGLKPKLSSLVSESLSDFNLRRDNRINDIDFDDDSVNTEDIVAYQSDMMCKIVKHIVDDCVSEHEIKLFSRCLKNFDKPFYKVLNREELQQVVDQCCKYLGNECDLNWIDVSLIKEMYNLFMTSEFNGDISKWDVSNVENMQAMFYNAMFNGDISKWNVSHVTIMNLTFYNAEFNGDISKWNVSGVQHMRGMFCYAAFNGDISAWDVSNVMNMQEMFKGSKFNSDISGWLINPLCDTADMFEDCLIDNTNRPKRFQKNNVSESVSNFNLRRDNKISDADFDDEDVMSKDISLNKLDAMYRIVDNMLDDTVNEDDITKFNRYLKYFDRPFYKVKKTEDLLKLVDQCCKYLGNECDLNWIDTRKVTSMNLIFSESEFNGDISKWDTHNVTSMVRMFKNSKFNGDISKWNVSKVKAMTAMFFGSKFTGDISNWDVSHVEHMTNMFYSTEFNNDLSRWDVSSVRDMKLMFCGSWFSQDISKWNVHNVTDMKGMFKNSLFAHDISGWDVRPNVNHEEMFDMYFPNEFKPKFITRRRVAESVSNFNLRRDDKVDTEFDDDEVSIEQIRHGEARYTLAKLVDKILDKTITEDEIAYFKRYCSEFDDEPFYKLEDLRSLKDLISECIRILGDDCDLNWIDVSSIKDMDSLFVCKSFNGDISKWDVSNVEDMRNMFFLSEFNGDISNWDVSHVLTMYQMFTSSKFNGDISHWDVSNVEKMVSMFSSSKFNGDISKWDVSKVTLMAGMFYNSAFNRDISNWDVSHVTDMISGEFDNVFAYCPIKDEYKPKQPKKIAESLSNFNLRRDDKVDTEFDDDEVSIEQIRHSENKFKIQKIVRPICDGTRKNLPEEDFEFFATHYEEFIDDPIKVALTRDELRRLLVYCSTYVSHTMNCNWIDVSMITDMHELIPSWVTNFNGDISNWDTHNVTDMAYMFYRSKFTGDISNWDVSNVKNMKGIFSESEFNGDISKWDVSHVTDMSAMFNESKFNGDISEWDVSHVTDMSEMFRKSLFNGDISKWDVSSVTDMNGMFGYSKFNGDISNWDVSHVRDMQQMFNSSQFNQDISKWKLTGAWDISLMFSWSNFDRDISCWDLTHISPNHRSHMFGNSSIREEFKPKCLQNVSESVSNFNLRRDNQTDIDFDDDEVTATDIDLHKLNYMMQIVDKILNESVTKAELEKFLHRLRFFKKPFYKPQNKEILKELVFTCTELFGDKCDLNWIDTSELTDMYGVFSYSKFNGDISKWDVSNVTTMTWMFSYSKFNGDISKWDVSNVVDMAFMFFDSKFNKPIDTWNVSNVRNMGCMFSSSAFNRDINKWDVSKVENMEKMFMLSSFNQYIGDWDVSKVTNMKYMFYDNKKFDQDISSWKINYIECKKRGGLSEVFDECPIKEEFKPTALLNLSESFSDFNLRRDNKTDIDFDDDEVSADQIAHATMKYKLQKLVLKILNQTISKTETKFFKKHIQEFDDDPLYTVLTREELYDTIENAIKCFGNKCDLNWIDVSKITNMYELFNSSWFNGDISKWDVSHVENMEAMFFDSQFNRDISKWDVSRVKNMKDMFGYARFEGDISNWDVSGVENMSEMFTWNTDFHGDISCWNVSNVTNMASMFLSSSFNGDISKWDVSHVTDMNNMFSQSLFNLYIGDWDVHNVKNMKYMFFKCPFNQDISRWHINSDTDCYEMFSICNIEEKFKPTYPYNCQFLRQCTFSKL